MVARRKYQARVCTSSDSSSCKDVGPASTSLDKSIRKMKRAMEKADRKIFGKKPKTGEPFRAIHGEVWEKERGKVVGDRPVYVRASGEGGEPPERRSRRRRPAADASS